MNPRVLLLLGLICGGFAVASDSSAAVFRAGVAMVDVSPPSLPVIQNGGFIEASLARVQDPLAARAFVFDDGSEALAMVVVDSCMLPRVLCDRAKAMIVASTGLKSDRILISATHTHTAPSVMDFCLGSRQDPRYTQFLPGKIAEAVNTAYRRLQPARMAHGRLDAGEYTSNRRWITRPDKMGEDPFGMRTVRAMMHPGHGNPDYLGPSGPIDPWLTFLSLQTIEGKPLGVLANFSMHYFGGHPGVSSDYYGEFARQLSREVALGSEGFVASMSQGTSGDLWWGDYSLPKRQEWTMEEFTRGLVTLVTEAVASASYQSNLSLSMAEKRVTLERRLPDDARLAWAREMLQRMAGQRPKNRPEVYAEQAQYIHENPAEELVLQAIRIGDLGIMGLPNEVYALTGLKLKAMSPFRESFNIGLANGAAGYIPPPEQHALGGYTTWPARTAGLAREAEPKIVAVLGDLMKVVSGESLRKYSEPKGSYIAEVERSRPRSLWRMGNQERPPVESSGTARAQFEGQLAFHLPGVQGQGFGEKYESRSIQFVGGRFVLPDVTIGEANSLEFWFQNLLPKMARLVTGTLCRWGGDELRLSGTSSEKPGRLVLGSSVGDTPILRKQWYHVVIVRDARQIEVFLDGRHQPELSVLRDDRDGATALSLAGGSDPEANLEGRLDEVAFYDRRLGVSEIRRHYQAAGVPAAQGVTQE